MADIPKACIAQDCPNMAVYAGGYCTLHAVDTSIKLSYICIYPSCEAVVKFGIKRSHKLTHCITHKLDEHVENTKRRYCEYPGCLVGALFSHDMVARRCYCHQNIGDNSVRLNRCIVDGCAINPSFGVDRPMYCAAHKTPDCLRFYTDLCMYPDCYAPAWYGYRSTLSKQSTRCQAIRCALHKEPGMIKSRFTPCEFCDLVADFGHFTSESGYLKQAPIHCKEHKLPNEINLSLVCKHKGCAKMALFCFNERSKARYCIDHYVSGYSDSTEKMKNSRLSRAVKCRYKLCKKLALFGYLGQPLVACKLHRARHMLCNHDISCSMCVENATHIKNGTLYCSVHGDHGSILIATICRVCYMRDGALDTNICLQCTVNADDAGADGAIYELNDDFEFDDTSSLISIDLTLNI